MESNKETGPPLKWECFPIELLSIIFRKLDTHSLVKCMYVCRSWNSVALYTAKKNNLWEEIVNKFLVDNGQMVKMKSLDMSWKDLFINSVLWSHCDKAELLLHNTYQVGAVKHVHVYKDNLIIVTSTSVKYFDLTKSEFKRDIEMECIEFLENDKIILKVTPGTENWKFKALHLYAKINVDDFNISKSNEKRVDYVSQYRLTKEGCYVYDNLGKLALYKPKDDDWNVQIIGRYYGSCEVSCYLHIFQDKTFILLRMFEMYCPNDQGGFDRVLNVRIMRNGVTFNRVEMFHNFGIIYEVEASEEFCFTRYIDKHDHRVFVIYCPGLSCVREHGEMLFLGYSDGKIEFLMPREMNEKAARKCRFNVTDTRIQSIDVYEERKQHHVFAATNSQVYHLLLAHTNIDDYLWSVYPERMSYE